MVVGSSEVWCCRSGPCEGSKKLRVTESGPRVSKAALGRAKQEDSCDLKVSLGYTSSSRPVKDT